MGGYWSCSSLGSGAGAAATDGPVSSDKFLIIGYKKEKYPDYKVPESDENANSDEEDLASCRRNLQRRFLKIGSVGKNFFSSIGAL